MPEIITFQWVNKILLRKKLISFVMLLSLLLALNATAQEMVIIDAGVADVQTLIEELEEVSLADRSVEVVVLDSERDGMEQLAELLDKRRALDALHLIAHGNAAQLQLGTSRLTTSSIHGDHARELAVIRRALAESADILIYGCHFGRGEAGQLAAERLAEATGADVAASDNLTGHASRGGDWALETQVGQIEARAIIAASWNGVLLDAVADIQATTQAATPSSYTAGGDTYTFGNTNNLLLTGVRGVSGTQYNVNLTGSRVVLRTVNNDDASGGPRTRLFAERSAGTGDFNLGPSLPGAPGAFDIEEILGGTILNRGALDVFMNNDVNVENALPGNVERLDYIFDSGITTPGNAALLTEGGHLYIEKNANNAAQVAAILSLDVDGNPASYGALLTIGTGDIQDATINGSVTTFPWSFMNDSNSTGVDGLTGGDIFTAGANPVQTGTSNEQIGGAVITFADLGLLAGQTYYGLSYFDGSISQTDVNNGAVNLVTLAGFDTNTNDNPGGADFGGGLGRVLISNAAAASVPPVANDDGAETSANTPVTLSVTANDTDSDGTIDVTTVDLDPATAGMQTTFTVAGEGTFSADGAGNVTFTPNAAFLGVSTITYTVDNDHGTTSNPANIAITVVSFDYGDAPDTGAGTGTGNYATLATDNGPAHALGAGSPYMGGCVDGDSGTLQDAIAFADDFNDGNPDFGFCLPPTDDDDGVVLTAAMVAGTVNTGLQVNMPFGASAANCQLDAWIDFNQNGDFGDPGEQIATNQTLAAGSGATILSFTVPSNVVAGNSIGRFRCSSAGGLAPVGVAADGEVEDHLIPILTQADLSISLTDSADPVEPGDTLTYTITVTNDGPSDAVNVVVTDTLPAGVTLVSTSGCNEDPAGAPTCSLGDIVTSSSAQYTVTVTIDGGTTGVITNTVSVSSGTTDPSAANNSSSENTTVNAPPVAVDDSASTQLNTPVTFSITSNDTDADGTIDAATVDLDPITAGQQTSFTVAGQGTFSVDGSGNVTFTPEATFTGASLISYTVNDNDGGTSNSANISVTVNAPPVANADSTLTQLDTPITLDVTTNDSDSDGTIDVATVDLDPATAGRQTLFTVAGEGSYSVDGAGVVTFTPDAGFSGASSITYTIADNDGGTSNAAAITVTVNAPPVAVDDSATTLFNTPVTLPDITANDSDSDGTVDASTVDLDPSTAGQQTTFTIAGEGTFSADGAGNVTFTPDVSFTGVSSISYTVNDNDGGLSNSATIAVTVQEPPFAEDDSATTPVDTAVAIPVLINDGDPKGDPIRILSTGAPTSGMVTFASLEGEIIYTPNAGFTGMDTFTYTIVNDSAEQAMATVTVVVGDPALGNLPPTAVNDASTTPQDTPLSLGVLANDYDPDGDEVTLTVVDAVSSQGGTASINENGTPGDPTDDTIDYTPPAGFTGLDTLTYTIFDDMGSSDTAIVIIAVTPTGADPVPLARGDGATTPHDVAVTIDVLANDSHPTPDVLTLAILTNGAHGMVSLNDNGTPGNPSDDRLIYTPDAGFVGHDTFMYRVTDSNGDEAVAAVTVAVTNTPPVAVDDSAVTQLNTAVSLSAIANDSDSDDMVDAATVDLDPSTAGQQTTFTVAGEGTFTVDISGTVTFTPALDFAGISAASYTVADETGALSNTATVTVTVNAPPVAVDDSALTQLDTPVTLAVTANDSDSDGTIDTATVDLDPSTAGQQTTFAVAGEGVFIADGSGNVIFTPEAGFTGLSSISYTVNDNDGGMSNPAVMSITVNAPPVAVDDSALTQLNTPVTLAVTANDSDSDGTVDPATVDLDPSTAGQQTTLTIAGQGMFSADGSGNVTFTPNAGFTGMASAPYVVNDNDGGISNAATMMITVNAPPVATDDSALTQLNTPVILAVTGNDSDTDGTVDVSTVDLDPATAGQQTTVVVAGQGTFASDGAGNVTMTPDAGFTGLSSITYTVNDNNGGLSNTASITVRINAPPVASDDNALTQLDTPVTLDVTSNDSDGDGAVDTATVDLDPSMAGRQTTFAVAGEGTFSVDAPGLVTFSPEAGFTGMSTASYTVDDNDGGSSNTASITVTINAPPMAVDDSALTQLNTPVTLAVTANDSDADGSIDTSTVDLDTSSPGQQTAVTVAGEGTFSDDGAGNVTFTPEAGYTGTSTLPYTVNDNDGGTSASATISVRVNAPPVAVNDSAVTPVNTPVTLPSITANDSDSDGTIDTTTVDLDPATAGQQSTVAVAGEGTFVGDGTGNITFTPEAGFVGVSTITYTVDDNDGATSNAATIEVTVQPGPAANADSTVTSLDTPVTLDVTANDMASANPIDVASVDLDPATPGQQTTFTVAGQGTFSVDGSGNVTFTPEAGFTGTVSIAYTIDDTAGGTSNEAMITIRVNAPPTAADDSVSTPLDTPVTLAVIANDADTDGTVDAATVDLDPATAGQQTTVAIAGEGTFSADGAGNVTFTPEAGFTGTSTASYMVNDNDGDTSNPATIAITVLAGPVANDDNALTHMDVAVTLNVTANDEPLNGSIDPATVDLDPNTAGQQTSIAVAGEGVYSADGAGNITFTPEPGFTGTSSVTYMVDDTIGSASNVATITIRVNALPTAVDDSALTQLDTPVTLAAIANDTDSDGTIDAATVDLDPNTAGQQMSFAVAGEGTFSVDGAGTVTFTPEAGFTGVSSIPYTVNDNDGGTSNAATVSVTVNASPIAMDDAALTQLDVPVTLAVIANDTDSDGSIDAATVDLDPSTGGQQTLLVVAGEGTFSADGSGNVTFTPEAGFTGVSLIPYTVSDNDGGRSNTASIAVTVNAPPVAADDSTLTQLDTPVSLNVALNDNDSDGNVEASTVDLDPSTPGQQTTFAVVGEGTFSVDGAGIVTFTPEASFTGVSSIPYTLEDNYGGRSNAATIQITVNAPPVAVDDSAVTPIDSAVTFAVTGNDTDADGNIDASTVDLDPSTPGRQTTVAIAGQGTFSVDGVGTVTFTPAAGFTGMATLTYVVNDNDGGTSNPAAITVNVQPGPAANDDQALTLMNTPVTVEVLGNDVVSVNPINAATVDLDPSTPGQQTTFVVAGEGTYSVDGSGAVTFTPAPGFFGTSSVMYTVADTAGAPSNAATLTIDINQPPTAADDSVLTQQDTPVTLNVTGNDTDADGSIDASTVDLDPSTPGQQTTFAVAGEGTYSADGAGNVTFTPDAGFSGTAAIAYTVNDDRNGTSNAATISITVNARPMAVADRAQTPPNTPVTLAVTDNDSDADGTIEVATVDLDPDTPGRQTTYAEPGEGTYAADENGNVTFTPEPGFVGVSDIDYTVNDNNGGVSNSASIEVTVNRPPVAEDDSGSTPVDTPVSIPVLVNDYDPEDEALSLTLSPVTLPSDGTVMILADGNVTYTPNAGFSGTDTFVYEVCDAFGLCDSAQVTVTVSAPNNDDMPPTAVADNSHTPQNTPVDIVVLPNDFEPEGGSLEVTPQTNAPTTAGGSFSVDNNIITYTPPTGFVGTDTLMYEVCNASGACDTAIVIVKVMPEGADPIPAAVGDGVATQQNVPVTVDVVSNDTHPDGEILRITEFTNGAHGTVALDDGGTPGDPSDDQLVYTPDEGFLGHDVFTYTVTDSNGDTTIAAVSVSVTNAAPIARDDVVVIELGQPITILVLENDTDPNGDPLTIISVTQPPSGVVVINPPDSITFTPNPDSREPAEFTYTIDDGQGGQATATVTVNLTNVFDPPMGIKIINPAGLPELEWRMVWINGGNVAANAVRITDRIPDGTTYVPGSVRCEPRGATTVDVCTFDAATNQVVYEGMMAADFGALTEDEAVNELIFSFRAGVPADFFGTVENQAEAQWDADGDGLIDDDITAGQQPVITNDPNTITANDPTVTTLPAPLGACLFQLQPISRETGENEGSDLDSAGQPAEGGIEGVDQRQQLPVLLGLSTPLDGHVVAGSSVAVAALHGPSNGVTFSEPITVTVANNDTQALPDIIEADGVKSEALPADTAHTVVNQDGLAVILPTDGLEADNTLEIATLNEPDLPQPLPGQGAAGFYHVTLSSGQTQLDYTVTLRLPYSDVDQNGRVDGNDIDEGVLTLWRYESFSGQWQHVDNAVVIADHNVVSVQTDRVGLVGLFRATDNRSAILGAVGDDVVAFGTAQSAVDETPGSDGWSRVAQVSQMPYVATWDTTAVADGDYTLRVVCAQDSSILSTFESVTAASSDGDRSSSNCFIATAAYGSPLEPQVQVLREFRDAYLMTHAAGRWVVSQYYRFSPPLADMIRGRDGLRAVVRTGLAPVVLTAQLSQSTYGGTLLAGTLLMLLGAFGLGYNTWRRGRNGAA